MGDTYLVNSDLYVWSDTENEWKNAGNITGPIGPTGPSRVLNEQYYHILSFKDGRTTLLQCYVVNYDNTNYTTESGGIGPSEGYIPLCSLIPIVTVGDSGVLVRVDVNKNMVKPFYLKQGKVEVAPEIRYDNVDDVSGAISLTR